MNSKTISGSILIIIGFLAYQTGVAVTLKDPTITTFLNIVASYLALNMTTLTLILEFGGGIIAIVGFILCISGLTKKMEFGASLPPPSSRVEGAGEPKPPPASKECKYCKAKLDDEDVFCPVCNKAQT